MLLLTTLLLLQAPTANPQTAGPLTWSATTMDAAATPANKEVLAKAKPAIITGEIIDFSCYSQLGKRGEAHKACGAKCVAHGAPVAMLTAQGKLVMLQPEQHHPRRDGQLDWAHAMSEKMGQTLTLTGMLSEQGGITTLFVEAEPMPAPAAK